MHQRRMLFVIDSHTAGEPTRIVVGGIPHIPGRTMVNKMQYVMKNLDFVRTATMQEPRGHSNMYGAIITSPVSKNSAFGVIFMDTDEYWNMCGHGTIGVITALIETGVIEESEPTTAVRFDTPAGAVTAKAEVRNGVVKSVAVRNISSFLYKSVTIEVPRIGRICADIAFGGNFCAIVSAEKVGIRVRQGNVSDLIEAGMLIKKVANSRINVRHPTMPHIREIHQILIYDTPLHKKANSRNIIISGDGQADRSPCGTGTSARMAALYARRQLELNEVFIHESVIGTTFEGRLTATSKVGEFEAVVPEIKGSAYVTGFSTFILNPRDPFRAGFLVR